MTMLAESRERASSEIYDKGSRRISQIEKKDMKDFIELAWKEVVMLENTERFQQRLHQSDGFHKSSTSRSPHISKAPLTGSPIKRKGPSPLPERKDPYDLNEQVRKRIEDQQKLQERLKAQFEQNQKKILKANRDWEMTKSQVKRIEKKCSFIWRKNWIVSLAEEKASAKKLERAIFGVQSSRNCNHSFLLIVPS